MPRAPRVLIEGGVNSAPSRTRSGPSTPPLAVDLEAIYGTTLDHAEVFPRSKQSVKISLERHTA